MIIYFWVTISANPWAGIITNSSTGKESICNAGDPSLIPGLGRSAEEGIGYWLQYSWTSLVAQLAKNLPAMQETWVWPLGWEDPLGKGNGYPLQYTGLENSMDYIVHGVTKSQTWLNDFHFLLCMKCTLGILIFLTSSLVFPILLFSSISLHWSLKKAYLPLLAIIWNSAFRWVYLSFSPLPFSSLLFSAICKASSDNRFAFLHFFFLKMVLIILSKGSP